MSQNFRIWTPLVILFFLFLRVIPAQSQSLNYEQLENDYVFKERQFFVEPQKIVSVEESPPHLKMTDYWTNKSFNPYKDSKGCISF